MNMTEWEAVLTLPVSPERDHIRGPLDAPVTLVEYGDYECPYCGAAHGIINAILARMGDQLCFAYRHFPLTTMHPHAHIAAEAAEAAGAKVSSGRCTTCCSITSSRSTRPISWRTPRLSASIPAGSA